MKIGVGALLFEGNTFSPVISGIDAFESKYLHRGATMVEALQGSNTEAAGAIAMAAQRHAQVVPLLATHGGAGGRVEAACYAALKAELLERLAEALPLDGLYLALHGAFVAEGVDDVEGDILAAVRDLVGALPVVISCDMHAHITPAMVTLSDALIGYQLYPHDDTGATGARAMRLLIDMLEGKAHPVTRACRIPMLAPAQKQRTSGAGPMARMNALARSLEGGPVHAVSYFCVQPWMDLPEMGFTAVVVGDYAEASEQLALRMAQTAWEARDEFLVETHTPPAAIEAGLKREGQIILADAADCVGGGAAGSSAEVLKYLCQAAGGSRAALHVVAPQVVAASVAIAPGETFVAQFVDARGTMFELPAELVSRSDGRFTYRGGLMGGVTVSMGPTVVVRCGNVSVLATSLSAYEYADEAFLANGIDPSTMKFVVVKNPMNYQAAYPQAAAYFVLATKGPTTPDLASLPWRRLDRPTFPIDRDFTPRFVALP